MAEYLAGKMRLDMMISDGAHTSLAVPDNVVSQNTELEEKLERMNDPDQEGMKYFGDPMDIEDLELPGSGYRAFAAASCHRGSENTVTERPHSLPVGVHFCVLCSRQLKQGFLHLPDNGKIDPGEGADLLGRFAITQHVFKHMISFLFTSPGFASGFGRFKFFTHKVL